MQMMRWYNPKIRAEEEVQAPMSEAQAIEMLSGNSRSNQFIQEYRRMRAMHSNIVVALTLTGETFYWEHRKGQPPH